MALSSLSNLRVMHEPRGVVRVDLDLPGRTYNVLNSAVFSELDELIGDLERDPAVRLVVFRSGKESGFLAGADLREIRAIETGEEADRFSAHGQRVMDRLERLPVPTVALIHGPCLGGGLELALACRYRLARLDERTQFGAPEVTLGLTPAWGGTQRLPELVGLSAALRMILQGLKLSAHEALDLGLIHAAWPPEQFADAAEQFLSNVLSDPLAVEPFHRRVSGLQAGFNDRMTSEQSKAIVEARQWIAGNADHGGPSSALDEALGAIEQGLRNGREAGLAREREAFVRLLFTPQCRQRLETFFQRGRGPQQVSAGPMQNPAG